MIQNRSCFVCLIKMAHFHDNNLIIFLSRQETTQSAFRINSSGLTPRSFGWVAVNGLSSCGGRFDVSFSVRWVCKQLSHSESVIFLSLFTSQKRGKRFPHRLSFLHTRVRKVVKKKVLRNWKVHNKHSLYTVDKLSKSFPFFSFPNFVLVLIQQDEWNCCDFFIFRFPVGSVEADSNGFNK